eukprot:COSAG05_NODE_315_length_11604_cov_8.336375_3_plen_39_part_00
MRDDCVAHACKGGRCQDVIVQPSLSLFFGSYACDKHTN